MRAALVLFVLVLAGCNSTEKQLERVAKDWALTIRASQVIPVYPLTEDLQPGDVFLVETPVQQQVRVYKSKGFLPLDQMVTRLGDIDFSALYKTAYWEGTFDAETHARPMRTVVDGQEVPPFAQVQAPRAAFPSYTFEVRRNSGAKVAIPIKGVPFGLGLMSSTSANGSVTISDAYTYAAEPEQLVRQIQTWGVGSGAPVLAGQPPPRE